MKNFIILLIAITLFSCNKNAVEVEQVKGDLLVSLSATGDYNIVAKSSPTYDINSFIVSIYKDKGAGVKGDLVVSYDKYSDVPPLISLPEGGYIIEAKSNQYVYAGFDTPYYTGSQRVIIKKDVPASVEVICALANIKVTVTFDQTFLDLFDTYDVNVGVVDVNNIPDNEVGSLKFTSTEKRAAYFPAMTLYFSIKGSKTTGVINYSHIEYIENVKPRDYYNIVLGVKPVGDGKFEVTVDKTTNDKDNDFTVPSEDESNGVI